MEIYGLKQRKKKKWWLIPVIVVAAAIVVIFAVGVTVNITNADHSKITKSVRENAELRRENDELKERITSLEQELSRVEGELAQRPTAEPEESIAPIADDSAAENNAGNVISPRNYRED